LHALLRRRILKFMNRLLSRGFLLAILCVFVAPCLKADEIELKDGKTFYGVIVAYDNNMFKIKTDFGFILVEKSKIASIVPMATDAGKETSAVKKQPPPPEPQDVKAGADNGEPTAEPAVESTIEKPAARMSMAPVRPEIPAVSPRANAVPPTIKAVPSAAAKALATPTAPLVPANEHQAPQIPEEVQGTIYTNHVYGFHIYKAPSWQLIEDPAQLPNAIVAMGTPNESTLMVVGREKTKQPLEVAANSVESRLHDVYSGYQKMSQRKTVVGGLPAVEYHYRGRADEHDWSGTLVVIARGNDIFTALGMTYADTDLIQIQENVIAKAIASLDFNAR
jgi:hypothetical protein